LTSGFLYSLTEHLANDEWKMTVGMIETHVFDTTPTCPDSFPHTLSLEINPPTWSRPYLFSLIEDCTFNGTQNFLIAGSIKLVAKYG
jgi:hypothetical protein